MMNNYAKILIKNILYIFLPSLVLLTLVYYYIYQDLKKNQLEKIKHSKILLLNQEKYLIESKLNVTIIDVNLLNELYFERLKPNEITKNSIIKNFTSLLKRKNIYNQFVFFDTNEHKIVHIISNHFQNAIINIKPDEEKLLYKQLQSLIKLKNKVVAFRTNNINAKGNSYFRLGKSIINEEGIVLGYIIIDLKDEAIFPKKNSDSQDNLNDNYVVNSDGYCQSNIKLESSSTDNSNKQNYLIFADYFKNEWAIINNNDAGQFLTSNGLYTYNVINVGEKQFDSIGVQSFDKWKIINYTPFSRVYHSNIYNNFFWYLLILALLLAVIILYSNNKYKNQGIFGQLIEREKRFKALLEATPDAMFIVDSKGVIIIANKHAQVVFCYELNELIGEKVEMLIPERFSNHVKLRESYINSPSNKPITIDKDLVAKKKNGEEFPISISLGPLYIENEFFTIAIIRDITKAKKTQETLIASEAKFRTIYDQSFHMIGLMDIEGSFIDMNQFGLNFIGVTNDQIKGMKAWDAPVWTDNSTIKEKLKSAVKKAKNGIFSHFEFEVRDKNNEVYIADFTLKPILNENNEVVLLVPEGRDITEIKKVESRLRESEKRYREVFDYSNDGIFLVEVTDDKRFKFLELNRAYQQMLDVDSDSIKNKYVEECLPQEFADNFIINLSSSLNFGDILSIEEQFDYPRGKCYFITTLLPIKDDNNEITRIIGIVHDIGELRQREIEIKQLNTQLEERVKQRTFQLEQANEFIRSNERRANLLSEVATTANSADSLEEVMRIAIKAFANYLNWPGAHVFIVENSVDEKVVSTNIWYLDYPYKFQQFIHITEGTVRYKGQGLLGTVLETKTPIWFTNISDSDKFHRSKQAIEVGIKTIFMFPIIVKDEVRAIIELFSVEYDPEDSSIINLATEICLQLGFVIERKEAEAALTRSEEKYRKIFENVQDIFFQTDVNGKILEVSPSVNRYPGYFREKLLGTNISEVYYSVADREKLVIELYNKGEINDYELRLRSNIDENPIYASINAQYILDANGNPKFIEGSLRDVTQRKKADELIRKMSRALEYSPVSVVITDIKGKIEYVNPTFSLVTGYTAEEILDENPRILKSGILPLEYYQEMWNTISTGNVWKNEFCNKKKNGDVYWEMASIAPIMDEYGEITHYVAVKEDITKRKYLEKLNNIQRDISFGLVDIKDIDKTFEWVTKNVLLIDEVDTIAFYTSDKEALVLKYHYGINQDIVNAVSYFPKDDFIYKRINQGTAFYGTFNDIANILNLNPQNYSHKALGIIPLKYGNSVIGEMFYGSNQTYEFSQEVISTVEVIASLVGNKILRLKAENSLQEREQLLSQLTENLPELLWLRTKDKILYITPSFEKMYEEKIDEAYKYPNILLDRIIDEDREYIYNNYSNYFMLDKQYELEEAHFEEEYRIKRKNGEIRWIKTKTFPFLVDDEIRLVGIAEDITQLKKLNLELIEAKDKAEIANRAKSEFLANMSHEIRTPMNAIIGFSELLYNKTEEPKNKSYLKSILLSSNALLTIINDILDLSKIEAGKIVLQPEYISIESLINELKLVFSLKLKEKNLEFITDFQNNFNHVFYLDEVRLRQILFNLIGNAVKFTEKGYIRVEVKVHYSYEQDSKVDLRIKVEDTGIGIQENEYDRIFETFVQQSQQKTKKYGGTGLGLTITKRLTEAMDGKIKVESEFGVGSKFYVYLYNVPVKKSEYLSLKPIVDAKLEPSDFSKATILYADSLDENRELLKELFLNSDIDIIEAVDGKEVIEKAEKYLPSVIMLDVRLPIIDGFEAAYNMKQIKSIKNIPLIAMTSSGLKEQFNFYQASGFDDFILKPFSLNSLLTILSRYLAIKEKIKSDIIPTENIKTELNENINITTEVIDILNGEINKLQNNAKKNQIIEDYENFGIKIIEVGEKYQLIKLTNYGKQIIESVELFDIDKLQLLINEYPNYINYYFEIYESKR